MTVTYVVNSQITGMSLEADTFENAKVLQQQVRDEYLASIEGVFAITAVINNEDGSKTYAQCDANGNPVIPE